MSALVAWLDRQIERLLLGHVAPWDDAAERSADDGLVKTESSRYHRPTPVTHPGRDVRPTTGSRRWA